MLTYLHQFHRSAHLLTLLLLCAFVFGGNRQASSQTVTTTLSKARVNRMLYVSNALDIIERQGTPEVAALAFYINATYKSDADYPADRLRQELQNASARYRAYYRSALDPTQNRFALAPYESVVYMLGILAALPGERNTTQRAFIASEAARFGSLLNPAGYLSESGVSADDVGVFHASSILGRGRGQEIYTRYRKQQLYALYDLAQTNEIARNAIDSYFGKFFAASPLDSGSKILKANPAFANSANFLRIKPFFKSDGTFTIRSDQFTQIVYAFQTDALKATGDLSAALNTVYTTYQRNYAGYTLDPDRQNAVKTYLAQPLTAFNQQLAGLSGFANIVDLSFSSDNSDGESKASAGMSVVSGIADIGVSFLSDGTKGARAFGALGSVLGLAGSAMGFADAFGLGNSPAPSNAELAAGMQQLNANLQIVSQDLANRINTVDAHLIELYNATRDGLTSINNNLNSGFSTLQALSQDLLYQTQATQAQISSLTQTIYDFFTAYQSDQRKPLKVALENLDNLLRNDLPFKYNQGNAGNAGYYDTLRNYATIDAMGLTEVGNFGGTENKYTQEELRYRLTAQVVLPEQNLNYLCGYADKLANAYNLSIPPVRSPLKSGQYLVNEPAWEMSMGGLLRLDAALPASFLTATKNDGPSDFNSHFGMRSLGRSLQQTAANVTMLFDSSQPRYLPSPLLSTLLTDYQTKTNAFLSAIGPLQQKLPPSEFVVVEGGGWFSLALRADGTVWAWGDNFWGELGDGTNTSHITPVQVKGLTGVIAIAASSASGYALKSDGTVWAWGDNSWGGLGDGTTANRNAPAQVKGLTGITAFSAKAIPVLALKSDGTVWVWGFDGIFQGSVPAQVPGLTGITAVSAGSAHCLALKSDGTVWAWGSNNWGGLGDGTNTNRTMPVQVQGLTGVTGIEGGCYMSLALTSGGTVWAWGHNNLGQLGDGTTSDRLMPVKTGLTGVRVLSSGMGSPLDGSGSHTQALKTDGTVWGWGDDRYGQLGDGRSAATTKTYFSTTPVPASGLTNVLAISAGNEHSLAVRSGGEVWAWGANPYGQIGDGTTGGNFYQVADRHTPVKVVGLAPLPDRRYLRAYVLDIANRYFDGTGGTQDYSKPEAANLYTTFVQMQNARTVLERFVSLGLSRSLAADTLPRALLYASVTDPFAKDPATGVANPNYSKVIQDCQRLPDLDWITALYNDLTDPLGPLPADLISTALPERVNAFQNYLTTTQQLLANEANARRYTSYAGPVVNQFVLGEPLADVELMLRRFDAFTMTKVTGTVQSLDSRAAPALRNLQKNGFALQVTLRNDSAAEPILTFSITPTETGAFTFYVPDGYYDAAFRAPGFLQRVININTSNSATAKVSIKLIPGDLSSNNRVDQSDLAKWRQANGSTPTSRNWNVVADLNGDGVVDQADLDIIRHFFNKAGDLF